MILGIFRKRCLFLGLDTQVGFLEFLCENGLFYNFYAESGENYLFINFYVFSEKKVSISDFLNFSVFLAFLCENGRFWSFYAFLVVFGRFVQIP